MKHTILITILAFFSTVFLCAQNTIPNNDFENWETNFLPENWETTNLLLPLGINNCTQSSNSYMGNYALQLQSIDLEGTIVPGVATIGTMDFYNTIGGIPFSEKPIALKGYFIHPSSGDEIIIGAEFFKNGISMGGGVFSTTDSIPEYTEFVVPLSYNPGLDPDTLNITILTDLYKAGSSMHIDGLEFEYQTTGTIDSGMENTISCHPNPSSGIFMLELGAQKRSEIQIYNSNGNLVYKTLPETRDVRIDLSHCKPGLYIAMMENDGKIIREKIIVN